MAEPIVEQMSVQDLDQCIEISSEAGLESWTSGGLLDALARPDSIALVARLDNSIAGFIIGRMLPAERSAEIYNIGVRRASQRHGVGSSLLLAFEAETRNSFSDTIWLEVRESNTAAVAFYSTLGFSQFSLRKGFYSHPTEDALIMHKKI